MEKTYKPKLNMWSLVASPGHVLHRIGSDDYSIRRTMVMPEDVDLYEEVAVADIPPYTEAEYAAKVSELVHERYSLDDEAAIMRKMLNAMLPQPAALADGEPFDSEKALAEYAEYNAYAEQCKAAAPAAIAEDKARQEAEMAAENADFTNAEDETPE